MWFKIYSEWKSHEFTFQFKIEYNWLNHNLGASKASLSRFESKILSQEFAYKRYSFEVISNGVTLL